MSEAKQCSCRMVVSLCIVPLRSVPGSGTSKSHFKLLSSHSEFQINVLILFLLRTSISHSFISTGTHCTPHCLALAAGMARRIPHPFSTHSAAQSHTHSVSLAFRCTLTRHLLCRLIFHMYTSSPGVHRKAPRFFITISPTSSSHMEPL